MLCYANPRSLVSTEWVSSHLNDRGVRLVEVIWGASPAFGQPAYEGGHIPGAIAWDFERDLQDFERHDVVEKPRLEALLSAAGISQETTIVLYSGLSNILATFAFWLLKYYGHQDVRLMDGDRQKWLAEGRQISTASPKGSPVIYRARERDSGLRAASSDMRGWIGESGHLFVDARSSAMYSGLDKAGAARGGHIPGAVNLPARREVYPNGSPGGWSVPTVDEDRTFKSVGELRALMEALGITPDKEIVTYCVRGGLSTHAWFVLTQLLGYPSVREYDRSWAEWGNLEGAPTET